jgi:hypothetical protein
MPCPFTSMARSEDLRHTEMQNVGSSCLNRFPITARSAGLAGLRLVPTERRHPYPLSRCGRKETTRWYGRRDNCKRK